ncbi:uncharacterized protein BT62DRAFT_937703 [Guyanagaster necrorhizus]|uniref:Isomerase YbhE n=1 Tax=Guyanagaster necrorhizus TaxID=856835 RepID=A0A9P8AMC1_9AGAR|nr:uncharacterized protein BT62DRAFT_937703 [Guyanagaster necrorhizus MCA 3950]KAG7440735.1 hypothetical protein BT62DRAFT_937703 [Guyanagaster necrorhizus MCA 3950]
MDIHILSGSFTSFSLFLLAFSPLNHSLRLLHTVPAVGPHQYIAQTPHAVYATTWASPPALHAWTLPSLAHIGSTPITATSSYITILDSHAYSVGGPTGEVHILDPATGAWKRKIQEILFVDSGKLDEADKTRKALRYGSHAIEFTGDGSYGFVPVLGTEEIHVFKRGTNGTLERVAKAKGHAGDGPRHVKVHPNGEVVYCVTEHSMFFLTFSKIGMLERCAQPTNWTYILLIQHLRHLSSSSLRSPSTLPVQPTPTGATRCYSRLQLTKFSRPLVEQRTSTRDTSLFFLSPHLVCLVARLSTTRPLPQEGKPTPSSCSQRLLSRPPL